MSEKHKTLDYPLENPSFQCSFARSSTQFCTCNITDKQAFLSKIYSYIYIYHLPNLFFYQFQNLITFRNLEIKENWSWCLIFCWRKCGAKYLTVWNRQCEMEKSHIAGLVGFPCLGYILYIRSCWLLFSTIRIKTTQTVDLKVIFNYTHVIQFDLHHILFVS